MAPGLYKYICLLNHFFVQLFSVHKRKRSYLDFILPGIGILFYVDDTNSNFFREIGDVRSEVICDPPSETIRPQFSNMSKT